jgi:hypothetical protein
MFIIILFFDCALVEKNDYNKRSIMQDNYVSWFEVKTPPVNVLSTESSGNALKTTHRFVSLDSHGLKF